MSTIKSKESISILKDFDALTNFPYSKEIINIIRKRKEDWNLIDDKIKSIKIRNSKHAIDYALSYGEIQLLFDNKTKTYKKTKNIKPLLKKIKNEIIEEFIIENSKHIINGENIEKALTNKQLDTVFSYYKKDLLHPYDDLVLRFNNKIDFISRDLKFLVSDMNIYFLDFKRKKYCGYDSNWEGGDVVLKGHNIFCHPEWQELRPIFNDIWGLEVLDEVNGYSIPKEFFYDVKFMNFHLVIDLFNFEKVLSERIELFIKTEIYEENLMKIKEKSDANLKKLKFKKYFDANNNGEVDLIEAESFNDFFKINKEKIQNINNDYILNFVKINKFLGNKKQNINTLFKILKTSEKIKNINESIGLLNNQIYVYNQLLFHSLAMINSLIDNDMKLFYEIYETFDELGVFNSKSENEINERLIELNTNIIVLGEKAELGMSEITTSIELTGDKINHSLAKLTYVTDNSIEMLTQKMDLRLKDVNSSIQTTNLLTLINTYQVYKINRNTKRLKK